MSVGSLSIRYGVRLVVREWRRFILPTLSLLITAIVLSSTLFLTSASQALLAEQARFLQGGDVVLESTSPINVPEKLAPLGITPERSTEVLEFSSSLQSSSTATAVSLQVVDSAYPLYGTIGLADGTYQYPLDNEILLDAKALERLGVQVGDEIQLGESAFVVVGVIQSDPTSLFSNFRFLPRALMSKEGFERSAIDATLLRAEYEYALVIPGLTTDQITSLQGLEVESNGFIQTRIAGTGTGGFEAALSIVTDFLVVAVLMTAVLAAVNVYASTLYFITAERKSFATLLSLGLTRVRLVRVIGVALSLVIVVATTVGVLLGYGVFVATASYIKGALAIALPTPNIVLYGVLTMVLVGVLALSAFIPTAYAVLGLSPKQLLNGEERGSNKSSWLLTLLVTVCTFLPILGLSIFLLESVWRGLLAVGAVAGVYVLVAVLFKIGLLALWKIRARFSFSIRSIIAQKKADGLFGVVSFASLFIALSVLSTLVLLQSTLEAYLTEDLATTVPSSYVIDIQPSQKDVLVSAFPELEVFSNTPARIESIDGVDIQAAIVAGDESVDRELGREFNITARDTLLESEQIIDGVWHEGRSGEISVDQDFADRANIKLSSQVTLSIQGFPVSGTVTSMRATDSRSGLPFFFFVMAPVDTEAFPKIFFGYAYHDVARQQELTRFLATDMPNVTVIETEALAPLLIALTQLLLLIVFVVTVPPLLIALLLIVTMIISSYAARRRESGRMRALGAQKRYVIKVYVFETVALTVFAALGAYLFGMAATYGISTTFLQVDTVVWFDPLLFLGLSTVIAVAAVVGVTLVKSDTMPLRELLAYAE